MKLSKKIKNLLKSVKDKTKRNPKLFFFFDYDGVLVPIQNNPSTAYLPDNLKNNLIKLARKENIQVALVSGRNVNLLRRLSNIKSKDITLIGSHGLEMLTGNRSRHLFNNNSKDLKKIKKYAIKVAHEITDGFLENKPYSFTFHIRDNNAQIKVKRLSVAFKKLITSKKLNKKLKVLEGKKIVEILPKDVTKGKAVEKIIKEHPKYTYLYLGDDVTDISALKVVKRYKGISVSLNPKLKFSTKYTLDSPFEVKQFVSYMVEVL